MRLFIRCRDTTLFFLSIGSWSGRFFLRFPGCFSNLVLTEWARVLWSRTNWEPPPAAPIPLPHYYCVMG